MLSLSSRGAINNQMRGSAAAAFCHHFLYEMPSNCQFFVTATVASPGF